MVSVQDFSLEFGIAEHGWLPVSITVTGNQICLQLDYQPGEPHTRCVVRSVEGSAANVLLPVWRSLRRFQSGKDLMGQWPEADFSTVNQLKNLILSSEQEGSPTDKGEPPKESL